MPFWPFLTRKCGTSGRRISADRLEQERWVRSWHASTNQWGRTTPDLAVPRSRRQGRLRGNSEHSPIARLTAGGHRFRTFAALPGMGEFVSTGDLRCPVQNLTDLPRPWWWPPIVRRDEGKHAPNLSFSWRQCQVDRAALKAPSRRLFLHSHTPMHTMPAQQKRAATRGRIRGGPG
jgi:hypothetical protein